MTNYQAVQDALSAGADPAMLCSTCPWDRYCVSPPTMTKAEVDAKLAEAMKQDDARLAEAKALGRNTGMPVHGLMTAVTMAGRDTMSQLCPVFALRLRSSTGRKIADTLKSAMQGWDDQS